MAMTPCSEVLGVGMAGDACVNIVHASPDAPAVDIYVDGAAAVENLAFGSATGWVALPAGEHQVQVTPTGEAADAAVSADMENAAVRVIHASLDAPAVDVAVAGGDVLVENLAFPDATEYLMVPAGTYDLEVRPTGTEDVALDLPGVELMAGNAYSVYAIGTVADGTLAALPIIAGASMAEAAQEATPEA